MSKMSTFVSSTWKKTYNQVPQEIFGVFCGSALSTLACYWPSSHCRPIPAQTFV